MIEKRTPLDYGRSSPGPGRVALLRLLFASGRYRWLGLLAFVIRASVYADWDGQTHSDWWARRWAAVFAMAGAVMYLEGLAAKAAAGGRAG